MDQPMNYNQRAERAIAPQNKVGRVSRLYGKRGEVVVQRRDGFPSVPRVLWIVCQGFGTPLWVRSCVDQGSSKVVVVFEDFESEELAEQLLGCDVYVEGVVSEGVEQGGGLSLLVGFSFTDLVSGRRGCVVSVYESAMNPLLGVVLEGEVAERLVPWADALVDDVDGVGCCLVMRLVADFFDEVGL